MRFDELARDLDRLEAATKRTELVRILSQVYRRCSEDEIEPLTYLVQGRLAPFFAPVEIGLGERLLLSAIAVAYQQPKEEVVTAYRRTGDLGMTASELAPTRPGERLCPLVTEVHRRLLQVAKTTGAGSLQSKLDGFVGLLSEMGPAPAKHLVRITTGRMRLGIGDPTVLDALSISTRGDRSLRPVLEAAYNRTSDLGLIARTLWVEGEQAVAALPVRVGRPLRSQLAERLPNPQAVVAKLGRMGVQPKYDGFRVQVHVDRGEVGVFSRNLENLTAMFPELVEAAARLPVESVILDGEAIAYDPESEEYLHFQQTMGRRRKREIDAFAQRAPLRAFVFDAMYHDGADLTPLPYDRRLATVSDLVRGSETLLAAPLVVTDSVEVLTRELLDNISRGLEGVVAKRMDSPYQAGARNFNWVKLKRNTSGQLNDTIDVVLLGYYWGKGRRAEFGAGALLAGVYDGEHDEFATITKIGTGLSDLGWRELYDRLRPLEEDQRPAPVCSLLTPDRWLRPEVVVEVLADEITPSPRHTCGMTAQHAGLALRFPRIVSFRAADRKAEDATTVAEVVEMYGQQYARSAAPPEPGGAPTGVRPGE